MKEFVLKYGKNDLTVRFPDTVDITAVEPQRSEPLSDAETALRNALREPIAKIPLADCAASVTEGKIGIIFNDITRATPSHMMLPVILNELAGVDPNRIILFDALGTHRPNTREELTAMLGEEIVRKYRIVQNDCNDRATQKYLGKTSFGHEIWINREAAECGLLILTGFIEPHFFAGFSGGGKAVMPGMAGAETIFHNHSAEMIASDNASWGITYGNPIWKEIQEVAESAGDLFLVNITMDKDHQITGVFCGNLREAHREGAAFAKKYAMAPVQEAFDAVITTNSGYPLDMNLYQSVKGMSAAARIAKPGAPIIIAAECSDGIPDHGLFRQMLQDFDSPREVYDHIMNNDRIEQDQWQIQILAKILLEHPVYVYSALDDELIRDCMMIPTHDIPETVCQTAPGGSVCIMPQGPLTIPYIR